MTNSDHEGSHLASNAHPSDGWPPGRDPDPLRTDHRPRAPKSAPSHGSTLRSTDNRLVLIHNGLRQQMRQLRDAVTQVASGRSDPADARAAINDLALQQNYRTLGSFCASYCRMLTLHHTIEDRAMFPQLAAGQPSLGPVVQRLEWEHEIIAEVLTALDAALVSLINGETTLSEVQEHVEVLDRTLHSHLDYEEQELVEPLNLLAVDV